MQLINFDLKNGKGSYLRELLKNKLNYYFITFY